MGTECLSVKVFLMKEEKRIEVRRMEMERDAVLNYNYVRERCEAYMRELQTQNFNILWQDADGDEVTISSNAEMLIAVSEMEATGIKFILRVMPKSIEDLATPDAFMKSLQKFLETPLFCDQLQAELFTQRVCNCCKELITSTSFKCLQCPHFYQCHECDLKNTHTNHIMLRINKEWTDQQKVHQDYFLGRKERRDMEDMRKRLKYCEGEHKKQLLEGCTKKTRKHKYKVEKKSPQKHYHILTYKKLV